MRGPLTPDDLDKVVERARTPKQQRAAATQLAAWAEEVHSDDDHVFPASLLVCAGEQLTAAGDHEAALQLFQLAVKAEGHTHPDVRCYLHLGLMQVGDRDGARRLADGLRHARLTDPNVYLLIGSNYELAGDFAEAHRWLTMGLTRLEGRIEPGDDVAVRGLVGLLVIRARVRRALDLPPDEYDARIGGVLGDD